MKENSEELKESLDNNTTDLENLKKLYKSEIHNLTSEEKVEDFKVICADAGRNSIEFKNRSTLIVARAAAVDNKGNNSRTLLVDILTKYSQSSFEDLRDRASESLEIEAIRELLEDHIDQENQIYVLIDGSLLTRSLVLPSELNLSKHQDYKLNLIENLSEIYKIAEKNDNVTLVGVSKDSNTDILYSSILTRELKEQLEEQDFGDKQELIEKVRKFRNQPLKMRKLKEKVKEDIDESDNIIEIIELLEDNRYDTEIIESFSNGKSFTTPVESGLVSQKLKSRLQHFKNNPESFVENYFPKTLANEDRTKEEINEIISKIPELPTIATFYWVPEDRAQPLRIDIPTFHLNKNHNRLKHLEGTRVLEVDDKIIDVLKVLDQGYAGESMHNVWISEADNIAGLSNSELENVFLPLMSQKLEINLREYLKRRDKRV